MDRCHGCRAKGLEKDRHKALQALAQAPEASRGAAREALVETGDGHDEPLLLLVSTALLARSCH